MSSLTTKLGIKRPDPSDPFLRQDFVDTYNLLDASPGVYAATSAPSWAVGQAGRLFLNQTTRQVFMWSGTAFVAIRDPGEGFFATGNIGSLMNPATTINPTLLTFTAITPGTVSVKAVITIAFNNQTIANPISGNLFLDGVAIDGNIAMVVEGWANASLQSAYPMVMQGFAHIAAGAHTIIARLATGSNAATVRPSGFSISVNTVTSTLDP